MLNPKKYSHTLRRTALAVMCAVSCSQALALSNANPTALEVTLYKTELYNGANWVTVMDSPTGVQVDLVGNPGTAFGSGSVDAGTYTEARFTVNNEIAYSNGVISNGSDSCAASSVNPYKVDGTQPSASQVSLTFSTEGGIGWRANGTDIYPYLLTQPITVNANATTNVQLAFKTANIVQCDVATVSVTPPSMDVISVLKPSSTTFNGGDYWIVGLNKNTTNRLYDNNGEIEPAMFTPPASSTTIPLYGYLLNSNNASETVTVNGSTVTYGPYTDPFDTSGATVTVGEYFRAQLRANSSNELRWGMKVRFMPDASDPSTGTVQQVRDSGKHRHQLDESWDTTNTAGFGATAAPTTDSTAMAHGTYTLDANNRFTITTTDGSIIKGAFDPNYEVLTAADITSANGDASLTVGVKVQTGSQVPVIQAPTDTSPETVYSWLSYQWEFERYNTSGATAVGVPWQAKQAYVSWDAAQLSVLRFSQNATTTTNTDMTQTELGSRGRMDNPLSMVECNVNCGNYPFWSSVSDGNSYSESQGMTPTQFDTNFIPSGSDVDAGLLSNIDSNPPWVAYGPTTGVLAVAEGTADTDPKWSSTTAERHYLGYTVGMKQAPLGTFTTANVAGNYLATYMWDEVNSGTRSTGSGYAELTLDGSGNLSATTHEKSSDGSVTNNTLSAAYSVETICIGLTQFAKDVAVYDNATGTYPQTIDGITVNTVDEARNYINDPAARLSPTDTTCTSGQKLQMVLGYDPAKGGVFATGNPAVAMMIGQTGDVLTFIDPRTLDSGSNRRQLGIAIKLK